MRAVQHPRTHGIPVATLTLRGHTPRSLDFFAHFVAHAAAALGIPLSRPAKLPIKRRLWTVLKGPFAHKKAQENFERKVHGRVVKAWDAGDAVLERWVRYLKMHPHTGVGVRVVRWTRAPVGIGRKLFEEGMSEKQRGTVELENVTDRERVRELAERIVKEEMRAAGVGEKGVEVPATATASTKTTMKMGKAKPKRAPRGSQ